jgi:hypothetical protein
LFDNLEQFSPEEYPSSENHGFKNGYFAGYEIGGYVDPSVGLPKTNFILYYEAGAYGDGLPCGDQIPPVSSLNIFGKGLPVYTIGGGSTFWGNNICRNKYEKGNYINYDDCIKLLPTIKNRGFEGICLDFERIDKTHKKSDLIRLLKEIKQYGFISIFHSSPEGPSVVDHEYRDSVNCEEEIRNENCNLVDLTGLNNYFDYYMVLLFSGGDKANPPLLTYSGNKLESILNFWDKPGRKIGKKYWGNLKPGSIWDSVPKHKLLGFVSCFKNGIHGEVEEWNKPHQCDISEIYNILKKRGWAGVITWAYLAEKINS